MLAWLLSLIQSAEASEDKKVKVENVISMQVLGGLASTKPSPLYKNNTVIGKEVITKITAWINSSVPIGEQPGYGRHGLFVPEGQIGIFKNCIEVKDEIVISNTELSLRAKSPQLYEWLNMWEKLTAGTVSSIRID